MTMQPSREEFARLAGEGYSHVPMVARRESGGRSGADLYAPLADTPGSYLLESGETATEAGRYSMIGLPDAVELRYRHGVFHILEGGTAGSEIRTQDPLSEVEAYLDRYRVAPCAIDMRFCGGLVGYFGYDLVRTIEPVLAGHRPPDAVDLPELWLVRSTELIVLDHRNREILLVVLQETDTDGAFESGRERLARLQEHVDACTALPAPPPDGIREMHDFSPGFTEEGFCQAVEAAREYIAAGDLMQVVLSQRLSRTFSGSAFDVYRGLLALNPSPYMYCLNLGEVQIVGASPEILVRRENRAATVRPIAGTRPRGATEAEDRTLEAELLADPKECAEHLMLIDLGRNDIGRVCEAGSVLVTERMMVERYSHVMHMVSNVEGRLPRDARTMDVLRATFPAGTVSGAPKVRAMQLIDELEPVGRSIYSGAIGYLGWDHNLDTAIAIRTAFVHDGAIHVQAGAGIVADSDPRTEWHETMHKAQALLQTARGIA